MDNLLVIDESPQLVIIESNDEPLNIRNKQETDKQLICPVKLKIINEDSDIISNIQTNTNNREFHCVYLLKSLHPKYYRRTYIGYTVNPVRRLRQHNGEIVGGASRTKKGRPWKMICYISG